MKHRFDFGQHVRVTRDIKNDGNAPARTTGDVLLPRGATGYITDVHVFPDKTVYDVDFVGFGCSAGCKEQDLIDADLPWAASRHQMRDKVILMAGLSVGGELVASAGTAGEVVGVERDASGGTHYHVRVKRRTFLVPETLLQTSSKEPDPYGAEPASSTPASLREGPLRSIRKA